MIDLASPLVHVATTALTAEPIPTGNGDLKPLIDATIARLAPLTGWFSECDDRVSPWIRVHRADLKIPSQGWKLHISATPDLAVEVLQRALAVLLADSATFKVAHSIGFLASLNQAEGGMSQIGKFITVYPSSDAQAVYLAQTLDDATRGLRGPVVPSDLPLRSGSLVHYRYGGFDARFMQLASGEIVPAITDSTGALVPDQRGTSYAEPEWVTSPFPAWPDQPLGDTDRSPLLADRFAPLARLHGSPRGNVIFALDLETMETCVVKQAHAGTGRDALGRDARDRLRHEAAILARLPADGRFPALHGLFDTNDDLVLAMTDMAGETMSQAVQELTLGGRFSTDADVVAWGCEVAAMLGAVHELGLIHRDIKPTNILRAIDGRFRLIDFELAHDITSIEPPLGTGTRGFSSPQQLRRETPAVTDDVYALGALLYLIATGAEPSQAPNPLHLLERPIELLNPGIGASVIEVIARCLASEPSSRFRSMEEVISALQTAMETHLRPTELPAVDHADRARDQAKRLGETLVAVSIPLEGSSKRTWFSTHPTASGFLSLDLNSGGAGPVLALAELVDAFDEPGWREVLAEGAAWLRDAERPGGEPLPGLYVGQAGVAMALLRAGQVLVDDALVAAAIERANWIATMPYVSPDLFNGTAGRIRLHLLLFDVTGDVQQFWHAIAGGEDLLRRVEQAPGDGLRWEGTGNAAGEFNPGYAHGVAGIGDVLLDLHAVTGDDRFREAARGAARWLSCLAEPFLTDGQGWAWPHHQGEVAFGGFWCHGAAGIGRFLLHAAEANLVADAMMLATGAARSVAMATRWAGPTQCHGLAGNIEFLLDIYQSTGDDTWLDHARTLAQLLDAYAVERDGLLMWSSDSPTVFSPDYSVGYSGVAMCLLRLSDPDHRPHQVSRAGFRYRVETIQ